MEIINKVRNTLRKYEMLNAGDSVLVCVSGGPDSRFLLEALVYLKDEFKINLYIANLDHGVRGAASKRDSLYVEKLAKAKGIKYFHKKIKIKKNKKLSLEEALRQERYKFFESTAKKNNINKIATAHTEDDMAETVLMRIIKGTSLKGIIGIPPKRLSEKIEYIRPLIEVKKEDILKFLTLSRIKFLTDSTNLENKYFRNVVRNKILPYLSKYNPRIKRALVNLAETLREDSEFIQSEKEKSRHLMRKDNRNIYFHLKDILIQPKALQKEITRDALQKAGSNIKKLNFRHWKEIFSLMKLKPSGKSLDLPGGIRLTKSSGDLVFKKI